MQLSINTMLFILILTILKSKHTTNANDCRCVSIFLCHDGTHVDHDDGNIAWRSIKRIVERKKKDCDSAVEICCEPENIIPKGCGIRNFNGVDPSLHINGNYDESKFGEFPWTIAILHNRPDKQDEYICDGALIHRKIVLTAAHCVDGKHASRIKIRAGEWDTQTTNEKLPHQDRAVENILFHGNYSSRLFHNDIALLILKRSLEIRDNVDIICLPENINELDTTQCVISGWSRNKLDGRYETVLKKIELQMVSRAVCQKSLHQTRLKNKFVHDESFICGDDTFGQNTWKGDGGSPFVCPLKINRHRFVQIGIAVRNVGCATQTPSIFANVVHARSWIDEQLLFHNLDNTEYRYKTFIHKSHSNG